MKKIILLSLLTLPFYVFAQDDEYLINGIQEPQWKDFAPVAYVDVKEPKGLTKFNDVIAYWYKRKVAFDKGIERCRAEESTEAKAACYQELKVQQYQKNSDYNARIEAMEQQRMNPQEMQDPTQNMYPIGGILNNIKQFQPNEFN